MHPCEKIVHWLWVSLSYRCITGTPKDNATEIIVTPEIVATPLTYKNLVKSSDESSIRHSLEGL